MKYKIIVFSILILATVWGAGFFYLKDNATMVKETEAQRSGTDQVPSESKEILPSEACPSIEKSIELEGTIGFLLVVNQENEIGMDGPECTRKVAKLYEKGSPHSLAEFSPLASESDSHEFILDLKGIDSACGSLLSGGVTIFDLRNKKFLLNEDLNMTLENASTPLAKLLKAQKVNHVINGYSPHENIQLEVESAKDLKFILTVNSITEEASEAEDSQGVVTTVKVRLNCTLGSLDCAPELISSSEKRQSLHYETCD